ncbi:uncharacterized protein FIBRA_01960 [Fibroporia radiculosa]|uniref:Uncharacterized protein n=1 Tax=Fibroporia radiculosa TaxID=599839 RepID=J4GLY8_9APHY|nr:uncharacterized protein FIBRA_01960 [Fibroporia radiculosa]CCL99935.1 predicted protein [Fibroporia radiculosa]
MEVRAVYDRVCACVARLVGGAGLDVYDVDEVVYVGGAASLPGLDEALAQGFQETVVTPFTAGTVVGGGAGDPTTIVSRGCALQAKLVAGLAEGTEEEREVRTAFASGSKWAQALATTKTIGMLFPEENAEGALGGQWIPAVLKDTPLPCRRTLRFKVDVGEGGESKVGFEVWEAKEGVKIEKIKPPKDEDEEPLEDEEEEDEIEVKEKTLEKETFLTSISFVAQEAAKKKDRYATIEVQFLLDGRNGAGLEVTIWEIGASGRGEAVVLSVNGS